MSFPSNIRTSKYYYLPTTQLLLLMRNLKEAAEDTQFPPKERAKSQWDLMEAKHVLRDRVIRFPKDLEHGLLPLYVGMPVKNAKTQLPFTLVRIRHKKEKKGYLYLALKELVVELREEDVPATPDTTEDPIEVSIHEIEIDTRRLPSFRV